MANVNRSESSVRPVDFFGVGFPKCGTTWVSRHLETHPEICFSKRKETNHFVSPQLVRDFPDDFQTMQQVTSRGTYHRLFDDHELTTGEFSVYYIYDYETLQNIKAYNNDAKVILCVRNPVDAAISNHRYVKNSLRSADFADDIIEELSTSDYLSNKYSYSSHIDQAYSIFGPSNVHVVVFNQFRTDPTSTLQSLYAFLGVDPSFISPQNDKKVYATSQLPANTATKLARPVVGALRRVGAHRVVDILHNTAVRALPTADKESYSKADRHAVYQYFADDIDKASSLLRTHGCVVEWTEPALG